MSRRLDRYVFLEILVPFGLGVAAFTFILLIARIVRLVELVINRGVPASQTLELFAYSLPFFLELTVPPAMLLAILVALGRLSADSEIVALRASGVGLLQIARPIAVFAFLAWGLTSLISLYVRPWGHSAMRRVLYEIVKTRATAGLRPEVFNDDFEKLVIYVDRIDSRRDVLERVVIADDRLKGDRSTLFAREGRLVPDEGARVLVLRLRDGSIHTLNRDDGSYHKTNFAEYDLRLDLAALSGAEFGRTRPEEMSLSALRGAIVQRRSGGASTTGEELELHRRFSIPFACVVFALIAVPLGIQPARAVRSRGFALSLALTFCYYVFLTGGETLATRQVLPAAVALWLPNVALGGLGAYLFAGAAAERSETTGGMLRDGYGWLAARLGRRLERVL
jgi:lipopolysaccharide export system permease protein